MKAMKLIRLIVPNLLGMFFASGCSHVPKQAPERYLEAGSSEVLTIGSSRWTRFACPAGWYSYIYETEKPDVSIAYTIYTDGTLTADASEEALVGSEVKQLRRLTDDSFRLEKAGVVSGGFGKVALYKAHSQDPGWNKQLIAIYLADDQRVVNIGFPSRSGLSVAQVEEYLDRMYTANLMPHALSK